MDGNITSIYKNLDLSLIFSKDINDKYLPIIIASKTVMNLFLSELDDIYNKKHIYQDHIETLLNILNTLSSFFKKSPYLCTIFLNYSNSNKKNLYMILCDFYIICESNEIVECIFKLLQVLIENSTCSINEYNHIYRNLREIFLDSDDETTTSNEQSKFNIMTRYFNLLNLFYCSDIQSDYLLQNYMYFTGDGLILLDLKESPMCSSQMTNNNLIDLNYGIVIHMWLYIECDYTLLPDDMLLDKNEEIVCRLVRIGCDDLVLEVVLTKQNEVKLILKEFEDKCLSGKFLPVKEWVQFKFIFCPKRSVKSNSYLTYSFSYLNNSQKDNENFQINYPFSMNKELKTIQLFENFIGRVTNVIVYNFNSGNSEDLSNEENIATQKKEINDNDFIPNKFGIEGLKTIREFQSNYHIKLYCVLFPEQSYSFYNNYNFILNNQISFNDGVLLSNNPNKYNGIVKIKQTNQNISLIGGINNLLPLTEILYKNQFLLSNNGESQDNLLFKYIELITAIFTKNNDNLKDAVNSSFFSYLTILLSNFPDKYFTQTLLAFMTTGTILFPDSNLDNSEYIDLLISPLLLSKFQMPEQTEVWCKLKKCANGLDIFKTLTMDKICFWLKHYDYPVFQEYCCQEHSEHFIHDNPEDRKVKDVSIKQCINCLCSLVRIMYENRELNINDLKLFTGMLSLKISPCLQIGIINEIIELTKNNDDDDDTYYIDLLRDLFNESFLTLLKYVFAVGIYDVKAKIVEIINIIFDNHLINESKKKQEELLKEIFSFFKENFIYDYFQITNKDKNNEKSQVVPNEDIKQIRLSFNNQIINKQRSYSIPNSKLKKNIFISPISMIKTKKFSKSPKCLLSQTLSKINEQIKEKIDLSNEDENFNLETEKNSFKSQKLSIKLPSKEKQLLTYIRSTNEKSLFTILVSIIHSSTFQITKYKIFIKALSSAEIPLLESNQCNLFVVFLADLIKFDKAKKDILSKKKFFINWFIETSIYFQAVEKGLFIKKMEKTQKGIILDIKRKLNELLFQQLLDNIIENIDMFIYFINTFLNYTRYFTQLFSGNQHIIILNNHLCDIIVIISKEIKHKLNKFIKEENSKAKKKQIKYKHPYLLQEYILDVIIYEFIMCFKQNDQDLNEKIRINFLPEAPSRVITQAKTKDTWRDYNLFKSLWKRFKNCWDINTFCDDSSIISKKKTEVLIFTQKFINSLVNIGMTKKKDKIFLVDEILSIQEISKIKKNYNKDKYFNKLQTMPFIQIVSNLFFVLLKLDFLDKSKLFSWLNKYQFFLVFCILFTFKINDNSNQVLESLIKAHYLFILNQFARLTNSTNREYFKIILVNITQIIAKIFTIENTKKFFSFKSTSHKTIKNIFQNMITWNTEDQKPNQTSISFPYNQIKKMSEQSNECISFYENHLLDITESVYNHMEEIKNIFFEETLIDITHKRNKIFLLEIIPFYSYSDIIPNINTSNLFIKTNPHYITIKHYKIQQDVFNSIETIKENILYRINKTKQQLILNSEHKQKYKTLKKHLFSWNNSWSEWGAFYVDKYKKKLKFKLSNYYSSNLMRPFLIPIIDIDYYLPIFSDFNVEQLFIKETNTLEKDYKCVNKKSNIYKVNTNYDRILPTNIDTIESKKQNNNLLKYLYCNVFNNEEIIKQIKIQPDNQNKIEINNNKTTTWNVLQEVYKKTVSCCIVKQSHHILCTCEIDHEKMKITKVSQTNPKMKEYQTYDMWDPDRKTCFGSIFIKCPKDSNLKQIIIPFKSIHAVFKRNYFFVYNSLEIFTFEHKSYFIHFKDKKKCMKILGLLINNKINIEFNGIKIPNRLKEQEEPIIGYIQNSAKCKNKYLFSSLNQLTDSWKNWKLSNFDFLMYINNYANRSFTDLNQYYVMPWILKDYQSETMEYNNERVDNYLRDLSLPMGMMEINRAGQKRKISFIDNYRAMMQEIKIGLGVVEEDEDEDEKSEPDKVNEEKENEKVWTDYIDKKEIDIDLIPYCYGSHYSNPIYVTHYLVRIFPYSSIMIEMQGNKFDDPHRLFLSVAKAFNSATTQKSDVREIIPEFFYLPEMFLNINSFNLGHTTRVDDTSLEKKTIKVDNVKLPPWADDNPYKFVCIMKEILEQPKTKINQWIDLIFGEYQKGRKSRKINNVFVPYSYSTSIDLSSIPVNKKGIYRRIFELGVVPHQLFGKVINEKSVPKQMKEQVTMWNQTNVVIHKPRFFKQQYCPCYYTLIDSKKLLVIFTDFSCGIIEFNSSPLSKTLAEERKLSDIVISEQAKQTVSLITRFHIYVEQLKETYYNHTYCVYNKGKNIVIGGFWEGNLLMYLKSEKKIIQLIWPIYIENYSPVTYIIVNSEETAAYCGLMNGFVIKYDITSLDNMDNKENWTKSHKVKAHFGEISWINYNKTLCVIATCGYDGYVNIFKEFDLKLLRSVYIEDFKIDKVILISSPLPSFIVHSVNNKIIKVFGLNSIKPLKEINLQEIIVCYKIVKDVSFNEFIVYGNDNGEVVIKKLPFFEEIRREQVFDENGFVKWIDLSDDIKTVYAIGEKGKLAVLCDKELAGSSVIQG